MYMFIPDPPRPPGEEAVAQEPTLYTIDSFIEMIKKTGCKDALQQKARSR